jgi:prevent-host-death family protein
MTKVGAYEAKTHLPQLIEQVLKGETIQITRHGVPVANLVPVEPKESPADVIKELRVFRKGKRLDGLSVKDLISEGRT